MYFPVAVPVVWSTVGPVAVELVDPANACHEKGNPVLPKLSTSQPDGKVPIPPPLPETEVSKSWK